MSIVIDKVKLIQAISDVLRDAVREVMPRLAISMRNVTTDSSGVYSEPLGSQIACISHDPNVICVQYTDGKLYYVRTFYVTTDTDRNEIVGDTIVHTHSLKVAPNAHVTILEVVVQFE
jgi:inosine-uridine nucleoside N-ribohydrolase